MLLVDGVHGGEVGHVDEEDVDLDDLGQLRAGLAQDGGDVGDARLRLGPDVALHNLALGVRRDLARHEDLSGRLDGLGLNRTGRPSSPRRRRASGPTPPRRTGSVEKSTKNRSLAPGERKSTPHTAPSPGKPPNSPPPLTTKSGSVVRYVAVLRYSPHTLGGGEKGGPGTYGKEDIRT